MTVNPHSDNGGLKRYVCPCLTYIPLPFPSHYHIPKAINHPSRTAHYSRKRYKTNPQINTKKINAALPNSPGTKPQKNLILVDVREPAELSSTGIIPSAVSVPLASQPDAFFLTPEEFETRFGYPKPGAGEEGDIVFYCKAGVRAKAAAQLAVQAGYDAERIGVYDGSWLDWADRKGKVERWEGESE